MLSHGEVHLVPHFASDRGDLAFLEATRIDELEGSEVGIDIEGEAVHRDVAAALHTDSTDLTLALGIADIEPDTRSTVLQPRLDLEEGEKLDDRLLQQLDISLQPKTEALQIEDGIAGDLPRAV